MRKPVGVIVAAVLLALMTGFGLLAAALQMAAMLFVRNPFMPAGALGQRIHLFFAVFDAISFCILAFCVWTVFGLARMRSWARYAIILIGIFLACISGGLSGLILYLSKFVRGSMAAPGAATLSHPGAVFVGVSLFYAALALLGVWWIVYFNQKPVREAFAAARAYEKGVLDGSIEPVPSEYGFWRIVVIAMAILLLAGGVLLAGTAFAHRPVYVLGFMVTGGAATLVEFLMAAIQIFIGIGLLRRMQTAYWTAIGWQVYGVASVAFLLVPSVRERLLAYTSQSQLNHQAASSALNALPSTSTAGMTSSFLSIVAVISIVVFLFFLYALLRTKEWYVPSQPDPFSN